MSKKVDTGTFLEYFSHRIIEIGIPVIITLIFDAFLTRFLESKSLTASFDRYFSQTITTESKGTSLKLAIIIAVVLIALIIIVTTIILVCYYYGCVKVIMIWMIVAVTLLLTLYMLIAFGDVPKLINTPFDWIGLLLFLINLTVVGDMSIFWRAPPIFTHVFLIIISVLVAIVFLNLPDWTVWILLVILIIYDCCVVLCPHGLLNVIIKKSEERGDSIPALVYSSAVWISKIYHPSNEYENEVEEGSEDADGDENSDGNSEESADNNNNENNGTNNDASPTNTNSNPTTNNNNPLPNANSSNNNNSNSNNLPPNSNASDDDTDINLIDTEDPKNKKSNYQSSAIKKKMQGPNKKGDESNQPLLAPNDPNDSDSDGLLSLNQTRKLVDNVKNKNKNNNNNGEEEEEEEKSEKEKKHLTEEEIKAKKRKRFESDDNEEGIKLGLGDFVFYGILVTRAARIGWDVAILCIFAVILGLSLTLIILAIVERPLPALPFSLFLGLVFYVTGIYTFRPFCSIISELRITF